MFLGNCPPTPPLNSHLRQNVGLGEGWLNKGENQDKPNPHGVSSWIRTQAPLVRGKCSHLFTALALSTGLHAKPPPSFLLIFKHYPK